MGIIPQNGHMRVAFYTYILVKKKKQRMMRRSFADLRK